MKNKLIVIVLFSIAMAFLESAVVVYLRELYNIDVLVTDIPQKPDELTLIEIGREAATLIMIAAIGWLTGRKWKEKIAYSLICFGVWDIFYYLWLELFINWPNSLFEWDLLFLIPLPWWGPVIAPLLISALMIFSGFLLLQKKVLNISAINVTILVLGLLSALFSFTENAISMLGSGEIINNVPEEFNWLFFIAGFLMLTYAVVNMTIRADNTGKRIFSKSAK